MISTDELQISTDGAVHEDIDVRGDVWIDADDVTIHDFRIDATGEFYGINVVDGDRHIVLEDSELHGMSGAAALRVGARHLPSQRNDAM